MSKVVVNFSLDTETAQMLDKMSKERKIPKSEIIRELLKRENLIETTDKIALQKKIDELIDCWKDTNEVWGHPYTLFLIYRLSVLIDVDLADEMFKDKNEFRDFTRKAAHGYWSDSDDPFKPEDIDAFADKAFDIIIRSIKIKKDLLKEAEECALEKDIE